jgi:flotillin
MTKIAKVREHVHEDLERMGFEIISYTIKEISDHNGYMDALGATQTSIVKREAAEGEAKNASEAQQKVAQAQSNAKVYAAKANREAHVSVNQQQEMEVESEKSLELRKAEQSLLVGQAKQRADAQIKTQQKVIETEIAEQEAKRLEVEAQGQAKARIVAAEAEAEKIRIIAKAEADAIRMKGEAEATNLKLQADAYNAFGQAALSHMLISKLPEIAAEVARPLAQTDKITFVSSGGEGGGPSALTRDITGILSQLPHSIQAMTGFDLRTAIQNSGVGHAPSRPDALVNRNEEEQVL